MVCALLGRAWGAVAWPRNGLRRVGRPAGRGETGCGVMYRRRGVFLVLERLSLGGGRWFDGEA